MVLTLMSPAAVVVSHISSAVAAIAVIIGRGSGKRYVERQMCLMLQMLGRIDLLGMPGPDGLLAAAILRA